MKSTQYTVILIQFCKDFCSRIGITEFNRGKEGVAEVRFMPFRNLVRQDLYLVLAES